MKINVSIIWHLPFVPHRATVTLQRLMDILVRSLRQYAAVYLGDTIHSTTCALAGSEFHVRQPDKSENNLNTFFAFKTCYFIMLMKYADSCAE